MTEQNNSQIIIYQTETGQTKIDVLIVEYEKRRNY